MKSYRNGPRFYHIRLVKDGVPHHFGGITICVLTAGERFSVGVSVCSSKDRYCRREGNSRSVKAAGLALKNGQFNLHTKNPNDIRKIVSSVAKGKASHPLLKYMKRNGLSFS